MQLLKPIFTKHIAASSLMLEFSPRWHNESKRKLFALAYNKGEMPSGVVNISRWQAIPIQEAINTVESMPIIKGVNSAFAYSPHQDSCATEWYLNFADGDLFFSYGSGLMAQDEHQVAEHPILGSVREYLSDLSEQDRKYDPCTREYTASHVNPPTPILIEGAERRLSIDLSVNVEQDRPYGLYGNLFAKASWEAVERAVKKLRVPTFSNIIAMEAHSGGKGRYSVGQIYDIFQTAFTAFSASRKETDKRAGKKVPVTINTGHWGAGAYGGSKILTACLQMVAAKAANIDNLFFHSLTPNDSKAFLEAEKLYRLLILEQSSKLEIRAILKQLYNKEFRWGISDGN